MKSKFSVIVAAIGLVAFIAVSGLVDVWAQQDDDSVEPIDPKGPIDAKFTDQPDKQQAAGGGGINGNLSGQILQTKIPDALGDGWPANSYRTVHAREVDAVANRRDAAFQRVIDNQADLLISIKDDFKGKGVWKVWYETPAPVRGVRWSDADFNNPPGGPPGLPEDLDALQLYGGAANRYSEETDPAGAVMNMAGTVYITRTQIWTALQSARLDTDGGEHFAGDSMQVDLDGLMVWDHDFDDEWDEGDKIIFSIKGAANWDGGEIVVWTQGQAAHYLNHGRHLWHTPFNVMLSFGVNSEEVDAIEAGSQWYQQRTPTLTQWGIIILAALLVVSTVSIMLRRRKAAVPA